MSASNPPPQRQATMTSPPPTYTETPSGSAFPQPTTYSPSPQNEPVPYPNQNLQDNPATSRTHNNEIVLQPPPAQPQLTPAQLGEQYKAELYADCARGRHQPKTSFGMCGIITAVLCFPCGLICLFTDSEQVCRQCGVTIS